MRSFLLSVVFVCSSVFAGVGLGQERPRAVLVDEHGQNPCDDSLGRLDSYFTDLYKKPTAEGLVVVSAKPELKVRVAFREGMIRAHAAERNFDERRFEIVRAQSDEDLKVQFWIVPPGAERPEVNQVDMTYKLPQAMTPFMLGAEYNLPAFIDPVCPDVNDFAIFARFLKGNPNARGNLLVRERDLQRAAAKGERILRKFESGYGISRKRLRVFTETRRANEYNVPLVEYWFLP